MSPYVPIWHRMAPYVPIWHRILGGEGPPRA
nr:MAG TPA: hypothetical protein [Caudoviricetes sp.]